MGSYRLRAGFAGELAPELITPAVIARAVKSRSLLSKPKPAEAVADSATPLLGDEALARANNGFEVEWPVIGGRIVGWDAAGVLWEHALATLGARDRPIFLADPPFAPRADREKLLTAIFETFRDVPSVALGVAGVCALYSAGRVTGLCLDCGDGQTHAAPVYSGFVLPHATYRSAVAGAAVSTHLRRLLCDSGAVLSTSARRGGDAEVVRAVKHAACSVSPEPLASAPPAAGGDPVEVTLPDGQTMSVESTAGVRAAEVLFDPASASLEAMGVADVVAAAVGGCDRDLRKPLLAGIVASGGSSMMEGFVDRLRTDVLSLMSKSVGYAANVKVAARADREVAVWAGAAICANLDAPDMWVTRERYHEEGPSCIHKIVF